MPPEPLCHRHGQHSGLAGTTLGACPDMTAVSEQHLWDCLSSELNPTGSTPGDADKLGAQMGSAEILLKVKEANASPKEKADGVHCQ